MPGPLITELGVNRTPCFGTCPVLEVIIRPSSYRYVGIAYVEPLGVREGRFSTWDFKRLERLVHELRIVELDDNYLLSIDDVPSTVTTVKFAGGVKKVIRADGNAGPDRLWAFANLIEKAVIDHLGTDKG